MSFYVTNMDHSFRLPGVAVLGAGATSPGTVERSQAMLVGQWAFSGARRGSRSRSQWISPAPETKGPGPACQAMSGIGAQLQLTVDRSKTSCQRSGSRWRHATQLHLVWSWNRPHLLFGASIRRVNSEYCTGWLRKCSTCTLWKWLRITGPDPH